MLRQAQWSTYYHRFFGRLRPGDRLQGGFEPPSLDETTHLLHGTFLPPDPPARPRTPLRGDRAYLARRCVSQMLLYGYRPGSERQQEFRQMTCRAAEADVPGAFDAADASGAMDFLVRWGRREFGAQPPSESELVEEMTAPGAGSLISLPTRIRHLQGSFEFEKRVYLKTDLPSVSRFVNPENWELLGEFFARTYREGSRADSTAVAQATPWQGVLREDFIVTWNTFTVNVFRQRLKVDYTVAKDLVRSDYALMYEEEDQIALNEGVFELRAEAPVPGWIHGCMTKRLKFTSSILNMLSPALLSMMLDSGTGGFNRFLPTANPAAGTTSARRRTSLPRPSTPRTTRPARRR